MVLSSHRGHLHVLQVLMDKCSADGTITYDEWMDTKLWFDKKCSSPSIRKLLWNMCAEAQNETSMKAMDPTIPLLYLCPTNDGVEGIRKAFAVVAKTAHHIAKITPSEVLRMLFPQGQNLNKEINLPTWNLKEMEDIVQMVCSNHRDGKQSVINFEQLMFLQPTSQVANLLRERYQHKDPYVLARTVPEVVTDANPA